jgi:uncharacterized protein (DUF488 family)
MRIFTIGFTKKTAEEFFSKLSESSAKRVVDIRLNNVSQLAGFSKRDDLRYFLGEICQMEYVHIPDLAPTQEILNEYRSSKDEWTRFEKEFLSLMSKRAVETVLPREIIDLGCLLCSEATPDHCHRRLVAEYLARKWGGVEIVHIV